MKPGMIKTRFMKAGKLISDYGTGYFVRRTLWKGEYRYNSDRHIYYDEWRRLNKLTVFQAKKQREAYEKRDKSAPVFIAAIDTDKSSAEAVARTKESVKHQTWLVEKVFVGKRDYLREKINAYLSEKSRNDYYIYVIPAGDELFADFFYNIADKLKKEPESDVVYTDYEVWSGMDKGTGGKNVCLLTDYSLDYLCAWDYVGTSYVTRAELLGDELELILKPSYLRLLELAAKTDRFSHVDSLLVDVRQYDSDKTENIETAQIDEAIRKAYRGANKNNTSYSLRDIEIYPGPDGTRRVKLIWNEAPGVSVIIPNKDHVEDLLICLRSLQKQNIRDRLEVLVVENNSTQAQTFAFYEWLETGKGGEALGTLDIDESLRTELDIRVLYWKEGFNYSAINNFAEGYATKELILLLNNDVELIGADAVEWLVSTICQDNTGIVGAKLYYEDETVQHAGDILGFGGVAEHFYKGIPMNDSGYMKQADCARRLTAVTAACLLVRKDVFELVGGLDTGYAVAFNDVDFCMKVYKTGAKTIYQPACEGWHAESKSRGLDLEGEKRERFMREVNLFRQTWEKELEAGDRYYNRNFSLMYNDGISYREPYAFDLKKQ